MDVVEPRTRVVRRRCAPRTFPCPRCGTPGRRQHTHSRTVGDLACQQVLLRELSVGEYRARCGCCKTFRSQRAGIEPRAEETNRVRQAVSDRLLEDGLSRQRLQQALARDFHLELSAGFLYDCLDWKVRPLDLRRPGAGIADAACGEGREEDGLPAQPSGAAAADQQSRGADEPPAALLREGAFQVAPAADGDAVRGAGVGAVAAAPVAHPREQAGEATQAQQPQQRPQRVNRVP